MKGCFVCKETSNRIPYVFGGGRRELFERELEVCPEVINKNNLEENKDFLRETEVILCTWDMECFDSKEIETYFPNLKAVFYAAGSVQYFARPFLEKGIRVISAWGVMAIPVAEFVVGQIVHANKGAYIAMSKYKSDGYHSAHDLATLDFPGTYETKVGILGAGMIGSLVIEMLKAYSVEIMVYDPFMDDSKAKRLGVRRFALKDIFSQCQTISNHIANNDKTIGMLDYSLFRLMKDNAAFINTGRGAQVVEADLARALMEKPNRCAILDVTWPEPCPPDHIFRKLPNVFITPHIAGYAASEVWRMADGMLEELRRFKNGEEMRYEVTISMLNTMA